MHQTARSSQKMKNQGGGAGIPIHYYLDNTPYFITAATHHHQPLLTDEIKRVLRDILHQVYAEYGWTLDHWVILDDHYHLLATSRTGRDITRIINKIHNLTARTINRQMQRSHKQVWYNYWDYCPRNERDYQVRLCYLLNNPCKHGYVDDLHQWPWSSFHSLYGRWGDEEMRWLFRKHREYRTLHLPEDNLESGS